MSAESCCCFGFLPCFCRRKQARGVGSNSRVVSATDHEDVPTEVSNASSSPRLSPAAWSAPGQEAVPPEVRREVDELLQRGALFRSGYAEEATSPVSVCERRLAEYLGFKYCVAMHSYNSALFFSSEGCGGPRRGTGPCQLIGGQLGVDCYHRGWRQARASGVFFRLIHGSTRSRVEG